MFWKKTLSLLQEKVSPPRPAWRHPFDDSPIRPPAGGKNPPTLGRRPSGAFRPIPEIRGDNVFGQNYFVTIVRAINSIMNDLPNVPSSIKTAFRRKFSKFLEVTGRTEVTVTNQSINDLLRFFNMFKLYGGNDAFKVKNFAGMMQEVFGVEKGDLRSEQLLRYFLFRFGIGPDDLDFPINPNITYDIWQGQWQNFLEIEDIFDEAYIDIRAMFRKYEELVDEGILSEDQARALGIYTDLLRDRIEKVEDAIMAGLIGESGISTPLMVIRQELIESFNSGDVLGVMENMIRYQTQVADLIDGLYDSIDHPIFNNLPVEIRVEIMEDLRDSIGNGVINLFFDNQTFTTPQLFPTGSGYSDISQPGSPFANLLSWLFGSIVR